MEESLKRKVRYELPKSAIIMTKQEVLAHQSEIIRNWKPITDKWPLTWGCHILSVATAVTASYINHRFRRKLRIFDYGWVLAATSITIPPCAIGYLFHKEYIFSKVLLLEATCPICLQSKAALIQCVTGVILPLIMTPISNFSFTAGSGVYNTPLATDWRAVIKVIRSVYQPMTPRIALLFTFHALLAGFITYSEVKSYLYIQEAQYLLQDEK